MAEATATPPAIKEKLRRFRAAYSEHRRAEGRGSGGEAELLALPYLRTGPHVQQWAIRSRTYERFVSSVLAPCARRKPARPLHVLDLGAGNGWLSYRVGLAGHRSTAIDFRVDAVDGLGAAAAYRPHLDGLFARLAGSFERLPLSGGVADIAVFNASLHYAIQLDVALREAARVVTPGGRIVIMDSPFYASPEEGDAMVAEKRREAAGRFGERAQDLLGPPFVEYLTETALAEASTGLGLAWRRHRVRYPLRYELRPVIAQLRGRRRPSRFDIWEAAIP